MKISGRNTIEFVEYMFLLIQGDTYSMIGDGDSHCFPRLAALNHNLCFLFRIFHGIVYQVTDDIAEMSAVGYYRQCFRFCFQCYVYGDIRF